MPVLAIANQKGGVGKTTTAINLGAALAREARRVLIVDWDPQGNATSGLGLREPGAAVGGPTIYDTLAARTPLAECIRATAEPNLFLAPASPDLAGAEVELATTPEREFQLRRVLHPLRNAYDFILVDCAPTLGLLTLNALTAADGLLIPVQAEYLALEGLGHLLETVARVRDTLAPHLRTVGVVLTMVDARTNLATAVVDDVRRHVPETFRTVIPRSVRLSEAPSFGRSIFQHAPASRGAEAYRELARELLARYALETAPPTPVTSAPVTSAPESAPPNHVVAGGIG